MPTGLADTLLHFLALEDILAQVLLARRCQHRFQLVEEEVQELLSVTLNGSVSWVSFVILVGVAELSWVDIAPVRNFKLGKQLLQLVQQVVIQLVLAASVGHFF